MNLLFVFNMGFDKNGPSVHLLRAVLKETLSAGHQCHVVLKKTPGCEFTGLEDMQAEFSGLTASFIESASEKRGFVKRYIEDCRYALKCKEHYKRGSYDAAFLQSCNVGWVHMGCLASLKCPVVFNVQDIFPQNLKFSGQLPASKITYPVFMFLQKIAYKKAARIITISEDMKQTLAESGVDPEKITVIYNWSYADDKISLENVPKDRIFDLKADDEKINVVYAGNIGKMQNVELIARAAQLSQSDDRIHYYIIGDGANKKQIEQMAGSLANVDILPMQPSAYAESIYAQADVNVIPLAKGGIKTALPSKTATVLRTDGCAVFCIDKGSVFEETIKNIPQARVADNADPESLYRVICELWEEKKMGNLPVAEKCSLFSKCNACRYVDALASVARQK